MTNPAERRREPRRTRLHPVRDPDTGANGNRFDDKLAEHGLQPLRAARVTTLQVNVGKLCNQACRHCHVDAGPHQTGAEVNMDRATIDRVVEVLQGGGFDLLDLTGGAPELNPNFRHLVEQARALGVRVMDRCNLSVLFEPGQEGLAGFLAEHRVEITASLPFYHRDRTDRQRGTGVFDKSIEGLRLLNGLGYGSGDGHVLNLVYNPVGAYLPADQHELEADYRHELDRLFDVRFDHLFCITNMPIARFSRWLRESGNEEGYLQTLLAAFNPSALPGVMCRDLVSIGPDGAIYDCDFNQMVGLRVEPDAPQNLWDFDRDALSRRQVVTGEHCLGCTAGAGSSCGGETVAD